MGLFLQGLSLLVSCSILTIALVITMASSTEPDSGLNELTPEEACTTVVPEEYEYQYDYEDVLWGYCRETRISQSEVIESELLYCVCASPCTCDQGCLLPGERCFFNYNCTVLVLCTANSNQGEADYTGQKK